MHCLVWLFCVCRVDNYDNIDNIEKLIIKVHKMLEIYNTLSTDEKLVFQFMRLHPEASKAEAAEATDKSMAVVESVCEKVMK